MRNCGILKPVERGLDINKGIVMQRRVFLLFILFVVLAGFYASVTRTSVPVLTGKQRAQTEQFNQIDQVAVSAKEQGSVPSSGD